MNFRQSILCIGLSTLFCLNALVPAHAAIALDRTRVVFNGSQKSISLSITNNNKELPYLAQGWLEDLDGKKIQGPLTVLPPVQRVEPGAKSQVKIQALPATAQLPQDRETLYYFNMREIPPRSNKPNTLQLALQTKIKLFYRPQAIAIDPNTIPVQTKLTLTRQGNKYVVNNPTPYYITLTEARSSVEGKSINGFDVLMLAPKSQKALSLDAARLGNSPVLVYVNDYGGRPMLKFNCNGSTCTAEQVKSR